MEEPPVGVLSSFPLRIPVQAGDLLGLYTSFGPCQAIDAAYRYSYRTGDIPSGTTAAFTPPAGALKLDVSAVLEPDCDSDGFGDETQDQEIFSCPPAPETTIAKGPKQKTKKKKARFEFTADEPGASFECSLDGGPFAPCASPHTVKVGAGKHSLAVRASDAGGNVEGSPVTDDWKRKRKRKK